MVSNAIFEAFLADFSGRDPTVLKILVIDNASHHAHQNITLPENIGLLRIPPCSPELDLAEKVWQWMKDKVAMKFFADIESPQQKITEMAYLLGPGLVKCISGHEIYTKPFLSIFE